MNRAVVILVLLIIAICLTDLRAQTASRTPPPTTQQLQSMIDAKRYPEVLQQTQRMLTLKGAPAQGIDRYDVYMLRAEAQLQLKQQGPAAQSYKEATKATPDPTKAGLPKAMVSLLQKSKGFMYTPRPNSDPTKPNAPLNIIDKEQRKSALAALFTDEWKPAEAKINALKKQGDESLMPIIEAAGVVGEMRGLEVAATGTDEKTRTALSDLTESAAKMMTDYLDRQEKRVSDIERSANLPKSNNVYETNRMGMTSAQMTDLKDIVPTCEKLALAAELVANSAGGNGSEFRGISNRAADLGKKAADVLNADYTSRIDNGVNTPVQRGDSDIGVPIRGENRRLPPGTPTR